MTGQQKYIALGNMMTSAALVGIDGCPEGFHQEKQSFTTREFDVDTEKWFVLHGRIWIQKSRSSKPKSRKKGYCYLVYNCFTFNYMSILGF
jgi:hypothetical protein